MSRLALCLLALVACRTTSARFEPRDGAAHDLRTGLTWERDPPRQPTVFAEAEARCRSLGDEWRLPTLDELRALVDERRAPMVADPALGTTESAWYWSSTPWESAPRFAWGVSFEYGGLHYLYRSNRYSSRCVRGSERLTAVAEPDAPAAPEPNGIIVRAEDRGEYVVLAVRPSAGPVPSHRLGQTVLLGLPSATPRHERATAERYPPVKGGLVRRRYTIISTPDERRERPIEVAVRMRPEGALSPRLVAQTSGAPIWISSDIRGPDLVSLIGERRAVILATGIGVAHFVGLARSGCPAREIVLIHGAKHERELWFRDELEDLAKRCPNFRYLPTLLEPTPDWSGARGSVEAAVASLGELSPSEVHVSMCATITLVDGMIGALEARGFRAPESMDWCEAD